MYLIGVLFAIGTLLFIRRFGMWGRSCSPKCNRWIKTLVVMGSGGTYYSFVKLVSILPGHTTEMIELLKSFDISIYKSFVYVLAETDKLSNSKVHSISSHTIIHFRYQSSIVPKKIVATKSKQFPAAGK